MRIILIIKFILILDSYGLSINLNKMKKVDIEIHGTEIKITNKLIASSIYKTLNIKEYEYDLVYNYFYKNDEYIHCKRFSNKEFSCAFYLNSNYPDELSSFYTDHDYGKSDLINLIKTHPKKTKAKYNLSNNILKITFNNFIAERMYKNLNKTYSKYFEDDYQKSITREGKQLYCQLIKYKLLSESTYSCTITVPLNNSYENNYPSNTELNLQ